MGSAVLAVYCYAFAAEAVRLFIGSVHGIATGVGRQVNRLADGGIAVGLEGGLHLYMPIRLYIVGASEDPANSCGDFPDVLDGSCTGDLLFELLAVEAGLLSHAFEDRVHLEQFSSFEDLAAKDK